VIVAAKAALVAGGALLAGGSGVVVPNDGKWTFPLHAWRGYAPTRSQEYRAPDHHGCDLMYHRRAGGADSMWPSGLTRMNGIEKSYGTKNFFIPDRVFACAARDGTIWECTKSPRGLQIVVDHGRPFATYYQHLSSVLFPLGITKGAQGIAVRAGQPLGVIGFDPSGLDHQKLMHLHFEVWFQGGANNHVDPWPLIERAPLPPVPEGVPL
jgi:hypothetical protein